jgi:hypothetical protein
LEEFETPIRRLEIANRSETLLHYATKLGIAFFLASALFTAVEPANGRRARAHPAF